MPKTDYVKGVSMRGLNKRQKTAMRRHKAHHTAKHLKAMATAMRKGKTFAQSHKIAMKKVGR
jgi:hypothetical protein|tara:strand:+ start:110 stop:295 length:186 start_codon:yes stop_codon:yes gene_type:complete